MNEEDSPGARMRKTRMKKNPGVKKTARGPAHEDRNEENTPMKGNSSMETTRKLY